MSAHQTHEHTEIGQLVRTLRVKAGLSQAHLGDAVACAPATVRSWERGETVPSAEVLPALAAALGVRQSTLEAALEDQGAARKVIVEAPPAAPAATVGPVLTAMPDPAVEPEPTVPDVTQPEPDGAAAIDDEAIDLTFPGLEESGMVMQAPTPTEAAGPAPKAAGDGAGGQPDEPADAGPVMAAMPAADRLDTSGKPWIDVPTEPIPIAAVSEDSTPDSLLAPAPPPPPPGSMEHVKGSADAPPMMAILQPSYTDSRKQKARYAVRLVVTLLLLAAGAIVLVWAFGELFEALGDVIDLFKDNTDPDLPAETMGISTAPFAT